jgi:hypothetical protein
VRAALAVVALCAALGGVAFAASSFAGGGRIHGCVTAKGKLTLDKAGKKCKTGRPIAWQKSGRRGRAGASGHIDVTVRQGSLTLHYSCIFVFLGLYSCGAPPTTATAPCADGERATDGGYGKPPDGAKPRIDESKASPASGTPNGWSVTALNGGPSSDPSVPDTVVPIYAVCVAP